jgi:uncharacterized heparinase superfamily protein
MKIIKKLKLFYFSIIYTPPSKLLNRLRLTFKRKFLVILLSKKPKSICNNEILERNELFLGNKLQNKENNLKKTKDGYDFTFLNQKYSFDADFDWHKEVLNNGTRLWKLNLHYFQWIVNVSDEDFQFFIKDWIKKNKPYQKNYWLDSWNSYALSIRTFTWINEIAKREKNLDKDFVDATNQSIINQICFLSKNLENDIGGNHIIKNIKALYYASSYFKGEKPNIWRKIADNHLKLELKKQILDDGFHFELSPAYHCQVFEDLIDCYVVLHKSSLKNELSRKLAKMKIVIEAFTHPDSKISLFNDGGINMASSPFDLLKKYDEIFNTKSTLEKNYFPFKDAGYYVIKNNLFHFIYDSGIVGPNELPAHSHGDIFSFELSVKKQRVFIDPGVFEYNAGMKRTDSRATKSHNTLTINDLDQCDFWSSFRMGKRADVKINEVSYSKDNFYINSYHTGYKMLNGHPIHKREIECSMAGTIKVTDYIIGGMGQTVKSRLLVNPEVQLKLKSKDEAILVSQDFQINIISSIKNISIEPALWWPNFGEEVETKRIVFDHGIAPCYSEFKIFIKEKRG